MKIGMNMLLWSTHVTEEHFPVLARIKGSQIIIIMKRQWHLPNNGQPVRIQGQKAAGAVTQIKPVGGGARNQTDRIGKRQVGERLHDGPVAGVFGEGSGQVVVQIRTDRHSGVQSVGCPDGRGEKQQQSVENGGETGRR